jgi:hypothetical protein
MLGFYLFAAILGGGLLVLSTFGHDSDGDVGGGHHGPGEMVLGFFRPRNLIFFLAAFGLTGTALTLIGRAGTFTAALAVAMGLLAMSASHAIFAYLASSDSAADVLDDRDLEGSSARVVLPVTPGAKGRVVCVIAGREQYLTAQLAQGTTDALNTGREVVIVGVHKGVAQVAPFDTLELPSGTSSTD